MIFRNSFKNSYIESLPALQRDDEWRAYLSGKGYAVSAKTALKVATVIRCVDVVAKTMASLPLNLFIETANGKEKATKHPLYKLLYRLPNPETTSYEFWHMYIFNLMLTTGGYAKIVRNRNGFIKELWNIPTANVTPGRNAVNNERYIDVYLTDGKTERLREGEFMFTPGLRFSDASGPEDPVKIAKDVLGLTMALNGFAKDFFENGANLGGVVETPAALSEKAYTRFKRDWQEAYAGIINQHKTAILEEGSKFNKLDSKLSDAQALESRKFEVIELCRMFGVPPHKVFELDRATFSNIEQQNIDYVQESISPMSVRIEQTIYKDCLTASDQDKYFAKFNINALLRGDIAARTTYYHNARQDGWMNPNDIRDLEDMNKIPADQGGDIYAVNGNMIPLSAIPQNLPKGALTNGKTKFWSFKAKDNDTGELMLYGDISSTSWYGDELTPKDFKKDLDALGNIKNLNVYINSGGGDVFAGQAIYSMLKRHSASKTVYIDGLAASIASVIAMAGDTVIMPKNAMMMIHNAWTIIAGNKEELRKVADDMEKIDESIVTTYNVKTGKEADEIKSWMDAETWMTAEEAVDRGFADEIEQEKKLAASIKGGILMLNSQKFDLSRYKNAPQIKETDPPNEEGDASQPLSDTKITLRDQYLHQKYERMEVISK